MLVWNLSQLSVSKLYYLDSAGLPDRIPTVVQDSRSICGSGSGSGGGGGGWGGMATNGIQGSVQSLGEEPGL